MSGTELTYLREMQRFESEAVVQTIVEADGRWNLTLDRTIFYPQGGGQPFDTGIIRNESGALAVEEVRWSDEGPRHIGLMSGSLSSGDQVRLIVDRDRRELNTRLHSAGHVVDMAVDRLGLGWVPGKGYHFPEGPYVEYLGTTELEREELCSRIERETAAILDENLATHIRFVDPQELGRYCRTVPEIALTEEQARVILYGEFGFACGGTHVARLADIGGITIRKIKPRGETIRVSYALGPPR
ncbi:MAG: hypothetical protein KY432_11485 [Acidobacteria bacterium]|nr:hypothetical protein [Acidobacteriota bacterium]